MRKRVALMVVSCFPVVSLAGELAVKETNYGLGASYSTVDSGSPGTQNSYSVTGLSRFAIEDNVGMQLAASIDKSYYKSNSYNSDVSGLWVSAGFFVRDYDIGSVNMGFSYGRMGYDSDLGSYVDSSYQSVSLSGTYYLDQFELGTGVSQTDSSYALSEPSRSSHIVAGYYINDNLKLSATVAGLDSSGRSLNIIFQPAILNNQWSISGTLTNGQAYDRYSISLGYYFDTKVSLMDRNRRY